MWAGKHGPLTFADNIIGFWMQGVASKNRQLIIPALKHQSHEACHLNVGIIDDRTPMHQACSLVHDMLKVERRVSLRRGAVGFIFPIDACSLPPLCGHGMSGRSMGKCRLRQRTAYTVVPEAGVNSFCRRGFRQAPQYAQRVYSRRRKSVRNDPELRLAYGSGRNLNTWRFMTQSKSRRNLLQLRARHT
ncbi:hypothetical protein BDV12DRAFT_181619 [Aspergillus spectabilis]